MTKDELFELHKKLCTYGLELMKKKNADYCKEGALANFRVCEALQITRADMGILVRVSDKMSRLSSILQNGEAQVKDESATDTIVDVINYMVLLAAILHENQTLLKRQDGAQPASCP